MGWGLELPGGMARAGRGLSVAKPIPIAPYQAYGAPLGPLWPAPAQTHRATGELSADKGRKVLLL